jgi:hypothetical protein
MELLVMTIEFTWTNPNGTKQSIEIASDPNDLYRDDEQMQVAKALGSARTHFNRKYGYFPKSTEVMVKVLKRA